MANQSIVLDDKLYAYMLDMGLREPDILQKLRCATASETMAVMRSAPEQGQFMAMLLKLMGARRVLEIGTYTGYATLWMALALPPDGELVSCDISPEWTALAQRYWQQAGVDQRITLHLAPALDTLQQLQQQPDSVPFDFIFIDADKENYLAYFEACLQLLRPGGLMIIDNVLWGGSVIDAENQTPSTLAIRAFNLALHADPRIELNMLPIADGITLVRKC